MTIDQPLFVGPHLTPNHPTSLSVLNMQVVSSLPQVNYVATHFMPTSTDNQFSDVIHHELGALELDLSFMTSYEL